MVETTGITVISSWSTSSSAAANGRIDVRTFDSCQFRVKRAVAQKLLTENNSISQSRTGLGWDRRNDIRLAESVGNRLDVSRTGSTRKLGLDPSRAGSSVGALVVTSSVAGER